MVVRIREVVQQALKTGYLTLEEEAELRQLLTSKYDLEDLNAFMKLQQAAMGGYVKQASRELFHSQRLCQEFSSISQV